MKIDIVNQKVKVLTTGTVVVGSGSAGFATANNLLKNMVEDVLLITENVNAGTSRNTGSDKQTYYKLTLEGNVGDSVYEMAETLFSGGSVDGDIALVEAALSTRGFFRLVEIGVPFPVNRYGEYVGYKTDHDPRNRGTSVGPLTSHYMTVCLEKEAKNLGLRILNNYQLIKILHNDEYRGVLCWTKDGYVLIICNNIVLATGGPASIYDLSVFPRSQTGASGVALESGIFGKNLTEWQYGMASIKPPWNVSGSYMQVLPRFISTSKDGLDEREFLQEYIKDEGDLLSRIFLKGYQWPFDVRKCKDGSSLIDILVYIETNIKKRRVFLDYTKNPFDRDINYHLLSSEAQEYLESSGIKFGVPVDRLKHINMPAFDFYLKRGIDLTKDKLEIALCAQHNNGGLATDYWWQTNIPGIFAVGEANGTHGVYRPGGAALNSGQVGAIRIAQYIAEKRNFSRPTEKAFINKFKSEIATRINLIQTLFSNESNIINLTRETKKVMDECGGSIRSQKKISAALESTYYLYNNFSKMVKIKHEGEIKLAYRLFDTLICQIVYLSAMNDYIERSGLSRSSALYYHDGGVLPHPEVDEQFRFTLAETDDILLQEIQEVYFDGEKCICNWRQCRPLSKEENFFENVWRTYRENKNVY